MGEAESNQAGPSEPSNPSSLEVASSRLFSTQLVAKQLRSGFEGQIFFSFLDFEVTASQSCLGLFEFLDLAGTSSQVLSSFGRPWNDFEPSFLEFVRPRSDVELSFLDSTSK